MKAKIIPLNEREENNSRVNFEAFKRNMNVNGNNYSDAELIKIRDFMYKLAEIECRYFKEWQVTQQENVVHLKTHNNEPEESIPLYPREHRRTG